MRNRRGSRSCISFWFVSSLSPRIKPTVTKKPTTKVVPNLYQPVHFGGARAAAATPTQSAGSQRRNETLIPEPGALRFREF
eukprot:COSAG01_NODE_2138_length_8325_cov_307.344396_4_plen_81_part_00